MLDDVSYNGGFTIKDFGKAMGIMEGNTEVSKDTAVGFNLDICLSCQLGRWGRVNWCNNNERFKNGRLTSCLK